MDTQVVERIDERVVEASDGGKPETMSLERLEDEICELAAHIWAATCRWLCLVAEFDGREGWKESGCVSCAQWLSWRCGLAPGAAREQLRVARRLTELPRIREAFARGELSYSKVRAVSRVASANTEDDLLMLAQHATAAQLERLVRTYRGIVVSEIARQNRSHRQRELVWFWDDDGSLVVHGRLPAEDGAVFLQALEVGRDAVRSASGEAHGGPGADLPRVSIAGSDVSAETSKDPTAAACLEHAAEDAAPHGGAANSGHASAETSHREVVAASCRVSAETAAPTPRATDGEVFADAAALTGASTDGRSVSAETSANRATELEELDLAAETPGLPATPTRWF